MSLEDKFACAELIQAWGLYRDQRRWDELLSTFHPDGEIAVSWFRGPFHEFVELCRRGGPSKHLIFPPLVRVAGDRALAETSIVILVRQDIEGLAVDMTSRARWTRFIVHEAERRGFSFAYWEFCSGFGAYDPKAKAWREPLRAALLER